MMTWTKRVLVLMAALGLAAAGREVCAAEDAAGTQVEAVTKQEAIDTSGTTDTRKPYYYITDKKKKRLAGYYVDDHTVEVIPASSNHNYQNINSMLAEKGKLTIIIPSGADIDVNGPLIPSSNKTIIATGATITMKPKTFVMMTNPKKKIHDLTVIGGTWRSQDEGGRDGSMFQFAFATNILLDGADVEANMDGHPIEIIASTNVTIQNCTVRQIGTSKAGDSCKEEAIQIDVASKKTAPRVAEFGAKYIKGQTCKNIQILNNTVYGARAVGVNYYSAFPNSYHKNIVIRGNQLHASTSEAIQYFNVIGGEISDNVIRTDATRQDSNGSYTIAVHLQNNGKSSAVKKSTITISGNTIYGNRNGIYLKGYFTDSGKCTGMYGNVVVSNNTVYCKAGTEAAISQTRGSVKNLKLSGNSLFKWTKKIKPGINLK